MSYVVLMNLHFRQKACVLFFKMTSHTFQKNIKEFFGVFFEFLSWFEWNSKKFIFKSITYI
eukprot:UN28150